MLALFVCVVFVVFCTCCGTYDPTGEVVVEEPETPVEPEQLVESEKPVAFVGTDETMREVPITVPPHVTKDTQGHSWEMDALEGLKQELVEGILTQELYDGLVEQVHQRAQDNRDHALNKHYTIYGGIIDPDDPKGGNLHGWQVNVVYGISMVADDFQITISGDWEIQNFSSVQRDDECWDVTFFIATRTHRGIIDWRGLLQPLAIEGN